MDIGNDYIVRIAVLLCLILGFYVIIFAACEKRRKIALESEKYIELSLIEKKEVTHDLKLFRFSLPTKQHVLGLPVGMHVSMQITDSEGQLVNRSYTPVSSDDDIGHVDFIINVLFKDANPNFPNGGVMTQYLENLKIGESVRIKGPIGNMMYLGGGIFEISSHSNGKETKTKRSVTNLGLIAGGTGITPMLQVIKAILKDEQDKTIISFLYANKTVDDILCGEELKSIEAKNSGRVKIFYTLDRPPSDWKGFSGIVTEAMIRDSMPRPDNEAFVLLCGPPIMIEKALIPNLKAIGYNDGDWYAF